ncbi:MAG: ABC transporter permease [Proteobacteria bacterium]|nr:ABC transporter permease [Pseudomonadota bacterium]
MPVRLARSLNYVLLRWVLDRPEVGLLIATALLAAYLGLTSEYFLLQRNLINITQAVAIVGIAAPFATLILIGGGIDLTPVTVFVIAGVVALKALDASIPIPFVFLLAVLAGGGVGLVNGAFIALLRLNPFIVTLGTNFLFTGIAFVVTDGQAAAIIDPAFTGMGTARVLGMPVVTIAMLGSFAVAFGILRFTRFGTYVYAVGADADAARLSGVDVVRVRIAMYVLGGLSAGVAGVLLTSMVGAVAAFTALSQADLLKILAAVIIGGTALTGGRGSVVGTLIGILLLGIIQNGLVLRNISSFYQPVVIGTVLLLAIVLDELRRRLADRV